MGALYSEGLIFGGLRQLVPCLPTNFALISLHNFLSRSSTRQQMLLTLNPVLSKSNAFKIFTKLHGICRAEAFCRAPHHSRKQSYGKWTVKMISLSQTLCLRIYCRQWLVSTRTRSLYFQISKLINSRTPVILPFSCVYSLGLVLRVEAIELGSQWPATITGQ